jgi:hypothetical protein
MEDGADEEILGNVPYTYTLLNTLWHRAIIYLMKVKNGCYTRGSFHREKMNIPLSLITLHLRN